MNTPRYTALRALLLAMSMAACGARQQPPGAAAERGHVMDPFPAAVSAPAASAQPGACQLIPIYFAVDSSGLDETARDKLWQNARCMRERKLVSVRVVGMTDPRGTEEYNLALGERRAGDASKFIRAMGVDTRLGEASAGEESASGADESGWARDRRVELIDEP
jgi:peptidoglycan-associated lipoprotein